MLLFSVVLCLGVPLPLLMDGSSPLELLWSLFVSWYVDPVESSALAWPFVMMLNMWNLAANISNFVLHFYSVSDH
jgi:hypothetical protein